jgi:hypothetical protein
MFLKFAKFAKLAKNILNTRQTRIRQNVASCGTRQTRPHSPKAIFEKNVTRLTKFARVIRNSHEFGASSHCLGKFQFSSCDVRLGFSLTWKQQLSNIKLVELNPCPKLCSIISSDR